MAYCEALHKKNNKKDKSSQTAIHSHFQKRCSQKIRKIHRKTPVQLYLERGSGAGVFQKVFGKF